MLRVYLTGDLCLTSGSRSIRGERFPGRQGRTALAYLVTERSQPVSRDALGEVLWPQSQPSAPEVALSAIISKLRSLFAEIGLGRQALTAGSGCYQLRLPAATWVDVEAGLEAAHLAEGALLANDPGKAYGFAVVACAILRRPFMPGAEGDWFDARREIMRRARLRGLDCLAQIHLWNKEHGLALRAAQEVIELEPFRESGYRQLMQLHERTGNVAEALRVYEDLRSLLAAELKVVPAPQTLQLFEAISARVIPAKTAEN